MPARFSLLGVGVFLGAWLEVMARAEAAAPVGVVLSSIEAPPAESELAGSIDLLVRSMLGPGQRGLVPTRELSLALEVLNGGRRREVLIVDPAQAKPLMERLTADRTFLGRLTVDELRWEVRGQVLGPEGDRLSSVAVQVPRGELNELARKLAERLAVRLGMTVLERPPVPLESLRPYARARAQMNGGDAQAAAGTLQAADPRPGTTVLAAREIVETLAANPQVAPPARMQMSLLAGDNGGARVTAEEILKAEPAHVQARAGKVRALAGMGDVEAAINEFDGIKKSRDPFAATANVALLVKRRYSPDRKGLTGKVSEDEQIEALAMALNDPDSDARPTLAFMSGAPPNALPDELEMAALGAAERTAAKDPEIAVAVGTRALKGGVQVERALPLAQPDKLESAELHAVKDKLDAIGPRAAGASKAVGQAIDKRVGVAEKLRLGGVDVKPADPELEPLAAQLRTLLSSFGVLQEQFGQRVVVVAKEQSEATWYLPFQVRRPRLELGLWRAAWGKPYDMSLVAPGTGSETVTPGNLTEPYLGNLVEQRGADLIVVHSAQSRGMDVEVELILFDGASATAYRTRGVVAGMGNGILLVNAVPIIALAAALLIPILLIRMWRRAGEVTVRVAANDATERRFSLLLSQSARPPKVPDAKQYAEEFDKGARSKLKHFARVVEATTTFERVKPGRWFVHLYGTYKTGKIGHILSGEEYCVAIEVAPRQSSTVSFAVTISSAEFHVTVQDKSKPLAGAAVWLDNDKDRGTKTNDEGLAVLKVAMGQRILRVQVGNMLIEKTHVVVKKKAHVIAINLDWERKVDDVSRALDNDPEVVAARSISATMPAQSTSATMPAQSQEAPRPPADAAISLPSEFLPPPEENIKL